MIKQTQTSYARGVQAEEEAAAYLRKKGYKILEARYKTRYGEIDIIARKKDVIVFVEVKLRQSSDDALYAITPKNRRRVEQAALHYMSENPQVLDMGMRFDVLALWDSPKDGGIHMEHLDNAWEAGS